MSAAEPGAGREAGPCAADDRLAELAAQALARPRTAPAVEYGNRWIDWGAMREVAHGLNAALDAHGIGAGAPVAFVPRNRPVALAALLGLIASRRTIRMIYAFQSAAAVARDLQQMQPAAVVLHTEDLHDALRTMLRGQNIGVVVLDDLRARWEGPEAVRAQGAPQTPRIEILTSGTTGKPKPFTVSYELILKHHIGAMADLSAETPTLLYFPLGNITGIYSTIPPLLKNQRVVLLDKFSVAGWHDYVRRYRPTATGLPPAGVQMVLDANIPREDLTSIRRMGTGAAPLDPEVQRAFELRYGIPILLSYGATEFGGPVTAMTLDLHAEWGAKKFGSVGRALPGAKLRVVDADSGEVLPPDREGILEVVSPRIGPEWIRTSDIALIDGDGFLFHRGRADGAIMRGGFKVLPETIERALLQHPAVSAVAATGIPDARLGQVPGVAVELKPGAAAPDAAALEAHLRERVPATHVPTVWRIVDALPRTPSFKVDRPALQRLLSAG
ncbi:MAG: fatty acid--CoA ligase family protein [Pseudomonadota bacterium]|nr:fatty acid--CoA ligase family protein [Pseudomonadota bacterium]